MIPIACKIIPYTCIYIYKQNAMLRIEPVNFDNISNSIVIYPNSVTTLRLARFDGRIEFQGPFLKHLAPSSLPKMSVIFSRGPNLKWPPGLTKMSIKNDFEQLCHQ